MLIRDDCKFKQQKNSLFIHRKLNEGWEKDFEYWRRIIPDDLSVKRKFWMKFILFRTWVVQEMLRHCVLHGYFSLEKYGRRCQKFCLKSSNVSGRKTTTLSIWTTITATKVTWRKVARRSHRFYHWVAQYMKRKLQYTDCSRQSYQIRTSNSLY